MLTAGDGSTLLHVVVVFDLNHISRKYASSARESEGELHKMLKFCVKLATKNFQSVELMEVRPVQSQDYYSYSTGGR